MLNSVGVFGVNCLDQLFCFMNVRALQDFVAACRDQLKSQAKYLEKLTIELEPTATIPTSTDQLYSGAIGKTNKMFNSFLGFICKIGQMQLLRRQISSVLNVRISSNEASKQQVQGELTITSIDCWLFV